MYSELWQKKLKNALSLVVCNPRLYSQLYKKRKTYQLLEKKVSLNKTTLKNYIFNLFKCKINVS